MNDLAPELLLSIFKYSDIKSLQALTKVSKTINQLRLYRLYYGHIVAIRNNMNIKDLKNIIIFIMIIDITC